jgi:hypothetical protein
MRSPPSIVTPSMIQCRPGCSGNQALSISAPFENFDASNTAYAGAVGSITGLSAGVGGVLGAMLGAWLGPVAGGADGATAGGADAAA